MMPTNVRAADNDVFVGGTIVSTGYESEKDLVGSGNSGKVTYNQGNLTLNDVGTNANQNYGVYSKVDLKVIIAGNNENTLNAKQYGILTAINHSVTLSGNGKLRIEAKEVGIWSQKDLIINSGTINATGSNNDNNGHGVVSNGDVTINGGSLSATGDDYGIFGKNVITINGGSASATGKEGIYAQNSITINGGSVSATGKTEGIYAYSSITINGGSVIAEATNNDGKAFEKQPIFNGTWYKWRTSKDGDFTDSNVTPYTWSANDKYVEIQPLVSKTTTSSSSSGTGSTVTACDHDYEWVEDTAATADSDAKFVHKCKKCGNIDMRMTEANSAYVQFLRESADKITKAKANATVKIEAKNWSSFQRTIMDALAKRPDVTLVIEYTDAGVRRQITIPAGTDLTGFIDDNGYTGFDFLVSKGLETDYWAGRLNK